VVAELLDREVAEVDSQTLPVLLMELGAAQGWIGALDEAATTFATAMVLCRGQGLTAMSAAAMSHLAMTEFMAGHDRAAAEVALEAFSMLGEVDAWRLRFAPSRAGLALFLGSTVALPWTAGPAAPHLDETWRQAHSSDLTARFWGRVRDALLMTWSGSVSSARALLAAPVDDPRLAEDALPRHLRVALLVGESLLAAVAADVAALEHLEHDLLSLGAEGEGCFVAGMRADCQGDRRAALAAFDVAADTAGCPQPPVRTLSLACAAQLLDSLGDADVALDRLSQAAAQTEIRRNGVAFLGWSRQGSPLEGLLRRLDTRGDSSWVHELATLAAGHADVISLLESSTPLRREQRDPLDPLVGPTLSPREREVLGELARGATYADIGGTLFLSPNTVKTHVSSLYSKLGVSRRSDALAIARSHHIL
jgi:DNA-binding CsgD family transcriptional regulator